MWDDVQLGEIVTLHRGYDLPTAQRREGAVPVVSSSGITGYHDEAKVKPPGVVTGRYGTLGEVFFVEEPFWPLNTTLYVSDFHGNDPRFVSYLLRCQDLGARDGAAAVPGINRNVLHRLPAKRPPVPIQHKIAAILSAYDDLIENNYRRIKILEDIARCIYRQWFVEFRYPGHENVPLVNLEWGPIPEGWKVSTLAEVCVRILDGDWIETKDQGGDAYRLLQVSNIGFGSFRETGKRRYISVDTFTRLRCTEISVGSILVSRMPDPVGRAWYVDHLDEPAITAVDVAIVEPDPAVIDPRYCAFYLNTQRNLQYAAQRASGTTRLRITRRDLETFPIPVPPSDVRAAFEEILEDNGRLSLALTLANRNLRAGRDLLLPRLISGESDVTDRDIDVPDLAA